jgi:hypothetical protein
MTPLLLISGSKVRALVRPPSISKAYGGFFSHFEVTVSKKVSPRFHPCMALGVEANICIPIMVRYLVSKR